jgi:hypothetical protein
MEEHVPETEAAVDTPETVEEAPRLMLPVWRDALVWAHNTLAAIPPEVITDYVPATKAAVENDRAVTLAAFAEAVQLAEGLTASPNRRTRRQTARKTTRDSTAAANKAKAARAPRAAKRAPVRAAK